MAQPTVERGFRSSSPEHTSSISDVLPTPESPKTSTRIFSAFFTPSDIGGAGRGINFHFLGEKKARTRSLGSAAGLGRPWRVLDVAPMGLLDRYGEGNAKDSKKKDKKAKKRKRKKVRFSPCAKLRNDGCVCPHPAPRDADLCPRRRRAKRRSKNTRRTPRIGNARKKKRGVPPLPPPPLPPPATPPRRPTRRPTSALLCRLPLPPSVHSLSAAAGPWCARK